MIPVALIVAAPASLDSAHVVAVRLPVPIVRQAPERCGPAALGMVLRFYRADSAALAAAEATYDPVLRGALITTLADAARRSGYEASVETLREDSIAVLLHDGVPPILLYHRGVSPIVRAHYGVIAGWDPQRDEYEVLDGGSRPRHVRRDELLRRWRSAGSLVLVVRPRR